MPDWIDEAAKEIQEKFDPDPLDVAENVTLIADIIHKHYEQYLQQWKGTTGGVSEFQKLSDQQAGIGIRIGIQDG